MLKILEGKEEKEYGNFMDKVAVSVFKSSIRSISELNEQDVIADKHTDEIAIAMGQVTLDTIIELTKDMSREDLVKWLAQTAIAHSVVAMNQHEGYKMKILMLMSLSK